MPLFGLWTTFWNLEFGSKPPAILFVWVFFEMEVTLLVREGRAGEDILIGSDCERCSNDSSVTNFTLYSLSQLRTIIYKMNIILDWRRLETHLETVYWGNNKLEVASFSHKLI